MWKLQVWIELLVWGLTIAMSRDDLDLPQIIHLFKLISPWRISMLPFTSNHLSLFFDFSENNSGWTPALTCYTFLKWLFVDCFIPVYGFFHPLFRLNSFLLSKVLKLLFWLTTLALLWFLQILVNILGLKRLNSTLVWIFLLKLKQSTLQVCLLELFKLEGSSILGSYIIVGSSWNNIRS